MSWATFIGNNPVRFIGAAAPPIWQESTPSGGGYVRNMDIAADGTFYVAGDVFPLYLSNTTPFGSGGYAKWQPVMLQNNFPANVLGFNGSGIFTPETTADSSIRAIAIAPTNSSIAYIFYSGQVYLTQNKGQSWTQVGTLSVTYTLGMANDTACCQLQHKIAVDPNNSSCVVVGTPENGFFVTTNGLSGSPTWTRPTGTPTSSSAVSGDQPGVTGIVFDPSSGTTGGLTNTVYAAVTGSGVWQTTTTVNGTWSLLSGSPVFVTGACITGGVYFAAGNSSAAFPCQTVSKFSGGTWSSVITDTTGIYSLTVNPNNSTNIVYCQQGGGLPCQFTTNGTNLLKYTVSPTVSAGDCPALAFMPANGNFFSVGQIMFDPVVSQRVWFVCGIGVFYTDSITSPTAPANGSSLTVVPKTAGLNAMVGTAVTSPPGGKVICSFMDRQTWQIANPAVEPSVYGLSAIRDNIYASFDNDWSSATPTTVICSTIQGQASGSMFCASSSDNGITWTQFGSQPWGAGFPVNVAASSPSNWCVLQKPTTGAGPMYFTTNGGTSFTTATGLPVTGLCPGINGAITHAVCADRVNYDTGSGGTFYTASNGNGIYISTNGGSTWSKQANMPGAVTLSWFLDKLKTVPNNAGHLVLNVVNTGITAHPITTASYFSANAGVTWTAISNITDVWALGFGQPAPGGSYPTIWIVGWVSSVWGVWVCKNFNTSTASGTWTQLTVYPGGNWQYPVDISGDMNDYTRAYISYGGGFSGSALYYGSNLSY